MADVILRLCPFCGGEAGIYSIGSKKQVRCKKCRARTHRMSVSDYAVNLRKNGETSVEANTRMAIEAWNRRTENG